MCWPQPPFHPKDCLALLKLLGPEEFEQRVCPLDVARERWRRERRDGYALHSEG